jgi:hypothetical protein
MALVSKNFSDIITFTRASTGTFFSSAGVLTSAAIDAPRFDYNPSTLAAQGLLIEESRTNSIRNNTMVGAVAGTPGTAPTNWAVTSGAGLSSQIVGTGTENGITYIDIRIFGTTAGSVNTDISFELVGSTSALTGQTWTESLYYKLVGGTLTNISSFNCRFNEYTSGSVFITGQTSAALTNPTSSGLATQRVSAAATLNGGATTAQLLGFLRAATGTGAVDYTLRIGLPQLELGAFATSVIPTTTTALTRAADVASVNTLSPWYNASAGTLFAQVSLLTVSNDANRWVAAISDGTTSNYIGLFRQTDQQPVGQVQTSAGTQAGLGAGAIWTTTASRKLALSYATNDFKFCTNGGTVAVDTAGTVPVVTQLQLGVVGSTGRVNGWLERVTFYPRSFSGAELQAITT